jgi:hypothetical protein
MDITPGRVITLVSILTLSTPTLTYARNCIKGKPCGKGCIAQNKTCRVDSSPSSQDAVIRFTPVKEPGAIIHSSALKLPTVATIITSTVNAKQSPTSNEITRRYKQGQSVFIYETNESWARISNMDPEEWVRLESLRIK